MADNNRMFDINKLNLVKVSLASPETIRSWSIPKSRIEQAQRGQYTGEITKPETINYRSQKPEPEGLFCEVVFGPHRDYECHCGKCRKSRWKGKICEKCNVEVISKDVRRQRMGHIALASPCTHIWFLKGSPSPIALVLNVKPKELEEVAYFISHICIYPGTTSIKKHDILDERSGRAKFLEVLKDYEPNLQVGSVQRAQAQELISRLEHEKEAFSFHETLDFINSISKDDTGRGLEFGEGAETIKRLLGEVDVVKEVEDLSQRMRENIGKKNNNATADNRLQKEYARLSILKSFIVEEKINPEDPESDVIRKPNVDNRPQWMVLDVLPVLPPDLRPMPQLDGGRLATTDLNDLYRRVIIRNARLKRLMELKAPYVITMNEKRILQEAVDALIDNGRRGKATTGKNGRQLKSLSDYLKGKQGRFRQNLLGKRVDYSGRSVIAVGPNLKMYECGLPREMAIQLLRPFIISELLKRGLVTTQHSANEKIDKYDEVVFEIVENIIADHPVLLNRAPTLHRLGIQAFQPKLVDGRAVRLHPLVCAGFNADFDGDQMAVHLPLTPAAQQETVELMLASNNILGPKDGEPIVTPSQDMVLGNYYLTREASKESFLVRAESLRAEGDIEQAELVEYYAAQEGKVFKDREEVLLAYQTKRIHLHNRIAILAKNLHKESFTEEMNSRYLITTVGKIIFNAIFPSKFPFLNEVNADNLASDQIKYFVPRGTNIPQYIAGLPLLKPFAKGELSKIIDRIFSLYGSRKTAAVLDKIKDQGFHYATLAGITVSIADINIIPEKYGVINSGDAKVHHIQELFDDGLLSEEEKHNHIVRIWGEAKDEIQSFLVKRMSADENNPVFMMAKSGARGSASNFTQLMGMRGVMANPKGESIELPIKSSFREGMNVGEFFIATHGARKGGADTALKTANSGYLTRRLVDVSQDVIVTEEDCGSEVGFEVSQVVNTRDFNAVIVPLYDRLVGRYTLRDVFHPTTGELIIGQNVMISEVTAKRIVEAGITRVYIRSLFGCRAKTGVCRHCYGRNLATGKEVELGEAVGVMAAQSIGEPGTQLTMRTFHTGGVAGSDITQGLPRVQELFEARKEPKGQAVISHISGYVSEINDTRTLVTVKNDLDEIQHEIKPGSILRTSLNSAIKAGDKITEGAISPQELLQFGGVTAVQKYILKEVQKVYRLQNIKISDKHIEVIVRQMLKKVIVADGGDSIFLQRQKVDLNTFLNESQKLLISGKNPPLAVPCIQGIARTAIQTESFLSAASFQETTRVLTDASIKAKTDPLFGLKENVITGKIIPTGFKRITGEPVERVTEFNVAEAMQRVKNEYLESHDVIKNPNHVYPNVIREHDEDEDLSDFAAS